MEDITFLHPQFFWLLVLLPLLIAWRYFNPKNHEPSLKVPSLRGFKSARPLPVRLYPLLFVLRVLALLVLIIALARPRILDSNTRTITTEGIDIVLAMDVSTSMLARDLKPDRLEVLKKLAEEFVDKRINDRIGIVVYSGESYTKTPLTSNHEYVKLAIRTIKSDYNELKDGTGIGSGLATAVNRLKDSKTKSKVVLLFTDGENNAGIIAPDEATQIADKFDIKVYTIGIGTKGYAEQPTGTITNGEREYANLPVSVDESLMKDIATKTEGKYFRAIDNASLETIYNEIDKMEKSEIKDKRYLNYTELFRPFLWIGLILALTEFLLRKTLYKSFI